MRLIRRRALSLAICVGLACVYSAAYVFPLLRTSQTYFIPSLWSYVVWPGVIAIAVIAMALFIALDLLDRYAGDRVLVAALAALNGALTLLAIKVALDAADLSWLYVVALASNSELNVVRAMQVVLTCSSFAVLFIASLVFRRRLRMWLRYLAVMGFTFVILAVIRVTRLAADEAVPTEPASAAHLHAADAGSGRRAVWVIFDELDYARTLGDSAMRQRLPQFTALEAKAVSARHAYPPAANTAESIPALLTGELVTGVKPGAPGTLHLERADGARLAFGVAGSIFERLPGGPQSASVLGFYHPYCRVFPGLGACSSHFLGNAGRWFDGVTFFAQSVFSAGRWVNGFVGATPRALWRRFDPMFGVTEALVDELPAMLARDDDALTFIHLSVPHVPGAYAQKLFGVPQTTDDRATYDGNLLVADWLLGRIAETLNARRGSRDVLLIASSDHWFRRESPATARTIPFFAWHVGERHGVSIDGPINTVHTAALVVDFVKGRITSHQEIADWWRAKRFAPTSIVRGHED